MPYYNDKSILLNCTPEVDESFKTVSRNMTLNVKNLSKRIGAEWLIKDASFDVERGEIFGIFCIDNATGLLLLELISGDSMPDEGQIFWDSAEVSARSKSERGFYFDKNEKRAKWGGLFSKPDSAALKSPQQMAAELDDALNRAESVLLLESKFALFSRQIREQKIADLKNLVSKKNICVLISTRDFEEVFAICTRVAIYNGGNQLQTGTPREVYESPNSVAVSIATGRNNIFSAQRVSSSKADAPQFVTINGEHLILTDKILKKELAPINQNVNLAIRPEHISISFGASFPEDNLLKAEITSIEYLGATTLLHLNAGGLNLIALVLRLVGLNVGDQCMVGLPPGRIQMLKD